MSGGSKSKSQLNQVYLRWLCPIRSVTRLRTAFVRYFPDFERSPHFLSKEVSCISLPLLLRCCACVLHFTNNLLETLKKHSVLKNLNRYIAAFKVICFFSGTPILRVSKRFLEVDD